MAVVTVQPVVVLRVSLLRDPGRSAMGTDLGIHQIVEVGEDGGDHERNPLGHIPNSLHFVHLHRDPNTAQ